MRLRAIVASVVLVGVCISPAYAVQASLQDRMRMSQSVADSIPRGNPKLNPFKTNSVEIGAAVIQEAGPPERRRYALADWRSADGKLHGQVSFVYLCDHWNVEDVSVGRPLSAKELIMGHAPSEIATRLVADLARLEVQHVTYLKAAVPGITC